MGENVKDSDSESELNKTLVESERLKEKVESYLQSSTDLTKREKENEDSPPPTDLKLVDLARRRRRSLDSSSDNDSVDSEFAMAFLDQIMKSGRQTKPKVEETRQEEKKESNVMVNDSKNDSSYLFPRKITWDQNRRRVNIRLHLTGVTESRVKYTKNSLSIRCNIGELVYGYDFHLYGPIKGKEAPETATNTVPEGDPYLEMIKQPEYVQVEFIKEEKGKWPRLLSSMNKPPAFIKSEYNNLSSASLDSTSSETSCGPSEKLMSNERRKIKNREKSVDLNFNKENASGPPKLVSARPAGYDDESSTNTDSSSDFEECINDVKDHGDIRWD